MVEPARREAPSRGLVHGLAAAVVVVAGLKLGATVLVPIAFALFLAVLTQPLFRALLARRVPVALGVLCTLLVLGAAFALFGGLLLGSLGELREVGPHYARTLEERIRYTSDWWQTKGISARAFVPPRWLEPETIGRLIGGTLRGTLALLSEVTIILLVLVFLLVEAAALPRKLERLPAPIRDALWRFANVSRELQRYLAIKLFMSATIGLAAGLWTTALGLDFAVLCALAAFAFHFVPNIGAVLAAAPAMVIAFVQYDLVKAGAVGAGYLVIGIVLGSLVEPALLGRRLGLSPLAVFVSLVAWGWLWGPIGMFLSVPLTMTLKILLEASPEWRWVAILLDSETPAASVQPVAVAVGPTALASKGEA